MNIRPVLAFGVLCLALSANAQTDRVLLPIFSVDTPGAFNSLWHTALTLHNGNTTMTGIDIPIACTVAPCHPPALYPGETHTFDATEPADNPGFIAHIQAPSENVWFNLTVTDLTRQSQTKGTEIPAVRESDFYDRPFYLFPVTTDRNFRVKLRLYELDGRSDVVVQIRALAVQTLDTIGTAELKLIPPPLSTFRANKPSYAEVPYIAALIPALPTTSGFPDRPYTLQITPKTAGAKIWGFLSVTHNDTQHVTTITPH